MRDAVSVRHLRSDLLVVGTQHGNDCPVLGSSVSIDRTIANRPSPLALKTTPRSEQLMRRLSASPPVVFISNYYSVDSEPLDSSEVAEIYVQHCLFV